jgi:hypothetical protein
MTTERRVFVRGERVLVDGYRRGSINYVRMAPPSYSVPECYSVLLDGEVRKRGSYAGTIVSANQVTAEPPRAAVTDEDRFSFYLPEIGA